MRDDNDDSPIAKFRPAMPPMSMMIHGVAAGRPASTASLNFSSTSGVSSAARADTLSLKFYIIFVDNDNAFPLQRPFDDLEPGK